VVYRLGRTGQPAGLSPRAPLAIQRRIEVRDALLNDYCVDYLYEDQLGARRWILDYHPSLDNPADYGWALMQIGREDAARCPIETEFGHDQALAFASAFYYWCLPPLSPVAHWPIPRRRYPEEEHWRRSFPYALYLSSGDTVVDIRDVKPPARLAWALLLGGRVHLGMVDEGVFAGPIRARIDYLQQLAMALGKRTVGDRLSDFRYLAPRVAQSTWENHRVVANLSTESWTLSDGTVLPPGGFDLQANDGFRAGRFQIGDGPVLDAMVDPDGTAVLLAAGPIQLRWGQWRLVDIPPPPPRTQTGRVTLILDAGPHLGAIHSGGFTPAAVAAAFAQFDPKVVLPARLWHRLADARVLVNPHSEHFVTEKLDEWALTVARLRRWIEGGGILVETGGWPLWIAAARDADSWRRRVIGPAGYYSLCGGKCRVLSADQGRSRCHVTALGRSVLREATIRSLDSGEVVCHRPPAESNAIILCEAAGRGYLIVRRLGHGAILRIGGIPTRPALNALAETLGAILDGRFDLGPPVWPVPTVRRIQAARCSR